MSTNTNTGKLAFSTSCVPGSEAELKEKERIAEFHRCKAARADEEANIQSEKRAKREQDYLAAYAANTERMRRTAAARMNGRMVLPR